MNTRGSGRPRAALHSKLAIAFMSTVISLFLLELAVRALGLAPGVNRLEVRKRYGHFIESDNPVLRYVPKPGSRDINDFGIRDLPFESSKGSGSYRILVLGDSVGFGLCNAEEVLPVSKLFPRVLEQRLNASHPSEPSRYQVLNLSVSGYNTAQEVEFLVEKGLDLEPDLVVLAYCMNDAFEVSAELYSLQRNRNVGFRAAAREHMVLRSHVARILWQQWVALSADRKAETGAPRPEHPVAEHFARLAQLSEDHGFDTLLVIFPLFFDYKEGSWKQARGWFNARQWPDEHRKVRALGEAHGFAVLDLYPAFEAADPGEHRLLQGRCTGSHPNEAGHALAAQEIERYLTRASTK
jgi:lysophospholipase L1-like esterase